LKTALRRRLPWLLLALLLCAALCARADYRVRAGARLELDRVLQRVVAQATVAMNGGAADLAWLSLYPEVLSAELKGPGGRSLGSYQNPLPAASGPLYQPSQERDGARASLSASLPEATASRRELPLLMLAFVLVALALPQRSPAPTIPSVLQEESPGPRRGNLVLELDAELRIQKVSRGVERLGYKAVDLLGQPMSSFVERFHPLHDSSVMGVARRGGGRLDSLVTSTTVENTAGELEKIVVTLAPPSSQEEESSLRSRYSRMQKLCEAVCDNARDCVVVLDAAASVVYANTSFSRALGGGSAYRESLLSMLRPQDRLPFTDALQTALDGGGSGVLEFQLEGYISCVLEGGFHLLSGASALAVGIFRDVTEARRLSQELEQARERAGHSQKIEALGRMAGGVAHDFNNLLTTLTLSLEAAKACCPAGSEVDPHLAEMELVVSKASSITRQLLLYSRKKPSQATLIHAHRTIAEAVQMTEGMRGRGVSVEMRLEAEDDNILLDDGQLDQVLLNLIVNAKDAMQGSGRIVISTQNRDLPSADLPALPAGGYLVLRVEDNGCGIPQELQARILEPYFTTKEVGKGTGLGLSTAAAVVEKAGGQLGLTSQPGKTVFTIWLPLAPQGSAAAAGPAPSGAEASHGRSVLLVEDENAIRTILTRMLEQRGYHVTSASTGSDAEEILRGAASFDVLITDLVLPGVSGPELAVTFQRSRPGRPVLFMSGFPGDTLEEAELAQHSRFLAKPFSPEQLMSSLQQLLSEAIR
jgi:signal transduction histidine kinase/CheY-like chemotaxis protein